FNQGTLSLNSMTVGGAGTINHLGATFTLDADRHLVVASTLDITGQLLANGGTAKAAMLAVSSGGELILASPLLSFDTALISNAGLIRGDGTLRGALTV